LLLLLLFPVEIAMSRWPTLPVSVRTLALLWGYMLLLTSLPNATARANERDGRLDIYFIDVEGGAATLLVTPAGESVLIDSGYPDNGYRDRDRILKTVRGAGLKQIDHAVVSHWHLDHFGNHAALAAEIPIRNFWDRGLPDTLAEDPQFPEKAARYRAAAQNQSKTLKVGDKLPLKSGDLPLEVLVVTASGDVLPNSGAPNPHADAHRPQPEDTSDNARSLSFKWTLGDFSFLCCGDLTWNTEARLVTPKNPLGTIELFMVTHHGLNVSNNPALVWAIDPRVAVTCNGPTKGGAKETQQTLRKVGSLQAMYQLHRNVQLTADEQAPASHIANGGTTAGCEGRSIKASVAPDGRSYTVSIEGIDRIDRYECRPHR
jgi:beta-lactamase superfamily II metal-dependent hydrolase